MKCANPNCSNEVTPKNWGGLPKKYCSDKCQRTSDNRVREIKDSYVINNLKSAGIYNPSPSEIQSYREKLLLFRSEKVKCANDKCNNIFTKTHFNQKCCSRKCQNQLYYSLNKDQLLSKTKDWIKNNRDRHNKRVRVYQRIRYYKVKRKYRKDYYKNYNIKNVGGLTDTYIKAILKTEGFNNPSKEIKDRRRRQILVRRELKKLTNKITSYEKK